MPTNCRGVEYDDTVMKIAGLQAKIAVFMQTMATIARKGGDGSELHLLAKDTIKRADNAQMNVHPDDLYNSSDLKVN
tara:strand:+ start:340 stop:570 length:231 start_codon:yes stop_codon:yes gene_type:complete